MQLTGYEQPENPLEPKRECGLSRHTTARGLRPDPGESSKRKGATIVKILNAESQRVLNVLCVFASLRLCVLVVNKDFRLYIGAQSSS